MLRLTSDFWVAAYRARLEGSGIFCHIVHRGDDQAGAIAVKLATMDGKASLYQRAYDMDGNAFWRTVLDAVPEGDVDAKITSERQFDRDLWVIEVEDPQGRHCLDDDGLT